MNGKIKIALADDEVLFRKGIGFILQREPDLEIVFEANNGRELINFIQETDTLPDIILMDLKMPELDGVEATRFIHNKNPELRVIALTSYDTKAFKANMIKLGAASYLVKNSTPSEVIFTIREVMEKGFYYDASVMKIIHEDVLSGKSAKKDSEDEKILTRREKEVLKLICKQLTTGEIADKLFISPRTVEGHRNNLLLKTESKNTAGLVIYGIKKELITVYPDENNLKK
ncbi:response regulator [Ascidiimonas sp. W6]|uniref:response regulator n=1 Tax=Ascidiimonas meishanensis TaxID=3128903 RepID=UPI0030EC96BB